MKVDDSQLKLAQSLAKTPGLIFTTVGNFTLISTAAMDEKESYVGEIVHRADASVDQFVLVQSNVLKNLFTQRLEAARNEPDDSN